MITSGCSTAARSAGVPRVCAYSLCPSGGSDSTLSAVLEGMHDLTIGSLYYEFSDCVVSAGAKTGTAEIGNDMVNGVFIAFAPYENPQIAVAVAIEKAGAGAELAPVAVDIINAYFSRSTDSTAPITGENTLIQ